MGLEPGEYKTSFTRLGTIRGAVFNIWKEKVEGKKQFAQDCRSFHSKENSVRHDSILHR